MRTTDEVTGAVVDAAIRIHRDLGPGLFESAYETLLAHELAERGLEFERQLLLPLEYRRRRIEFGYRVDLLVEQRVVVEIKSTDRPSPIHSRQLLTYLRLANLGVGLLINFGTYRLVDGIQRITNSLVEETAHTDKPRKGEKEPPPWIDGQLPFSRSPFLRVGSSAATRRARAGAPAQPTSLAARYALSCDTSTRSCASESRSRTVTVWSPVLCPSTVMQNGVPTSS
jgi:GxxExxY protein